MKRLSLLLLAVPLIAGCWRSDPPVEEGRVSSASLLIGSGAVVGKDDLTGYISGGEWTEYESPNGVFRMLVPASVLDGVHPECAKPVPVFIRENGSRTTIVQEYYYSPSCERVITPTNREIYEQGKPEFPFDDEGNILTDFYDERVAGSLLHLWSTRVSSRTELIAWLRNIYGLGCRLQQDDREAGVVEWSLEPATQDADPFACGGTVMYEPETGAVVTYFLPLEVAVTFFRDASGGGATSYDQKLKESIELLAGSGSLL